MFRLRFWLISFFVILSLLFSFYAFPQEYSGIKKIVLGNFKTENGKTVYSKNDPHWDGVFRLNIAIDDHENIYVLDVWNNRILIYSNTGKRIGVINLSLKFDTIEELQISKDGKQFIIGGDVVTHIVDRKGKVINTIEDTFLIREMKDKVLRDPTTDSKGNYYYCGKEDLIKKSPSKKIILRKQLPECRSIIGVDRKDNVYLEIEAGPGGRGDWKFIKLNKDGKLTKTVPFPHSIHYPIQFNDKDWEEFEDTPSDEPLKWYKLSSKGNIYAIYSFWQLPKGALDRWIKGGEYFIYKIEMAE